MKWIEIRVVTTEEANDAISEMFTSIGAGGVAIEDPNDIRKEISKAGSLDYADDEFLSSLGSDVVIKAYFPGTVNITELLELIKEKIRFISNFLDTGKGYDGYLEINEEDWANGWKKYYKPVKISERIVIKPSWEQYKAQDDEIIVELDPGMAFGTGTHETTRLCVQMLEKYLNKGDTVIDVGCGTGILSIAALKLGAESVTAVDVDEVAVRVTKENCAMNGVAEKVDAFAGELKDIKAFKADAVVANIIANVIINMSGIVNDYLKAGGYFITSGIIKERKHEVEEAYLKQGFTCEGTVEMGEWVAMVFNLKDFRLES